MSSHDRTIAAIAARQHGVVTRAQLLDSGLTAAEVDGRVRSARLRPLHRGVYLLGALVGPLEPSRARETAALLACGPGAVLSHGSAAALWRMLPIRRPRSPVHVSLADGDRGRRPGIRAHRVGTLRPEDRTVYEGVPVTSPARTIVDLAARVRPRTLEQALARAERMELVERGDVAAVLDRGPRLRGASRLRRVLAERARPAFTRSRAEERFLSLVRKGGLPEPEANARVRRWEVDFLWRSRRVVVEVDGFAHHASRWMFEDDRRRDAVLATEGYRVVRVTWRQLVGEPHAVLVRITRILALRADPR